jgi:signal transduction histidine kinase
MVATNAITFLSYLTICCTLLYLARRTGRVIARDWAYFTVGFALFIVACGSTHLLEVITTWIPIFWIDAWTNIVTAILSAYVALQLIRRVAIIAFSINDYADRLSNAEHEKLRMQESLLALQKLEDWSRMSAVVTHEIANPLEAIHNLLYLIRTQDGVSPDIVQLATAADEEASRVLTISKSTLSFFRQSNDPEQVDLLAAAESVRLVLEPLLEKQKVTLDVARKGDATIEALAGETRQVLLNLVRNAVEASSPGSEVDVRLARRPDEVEIVVADQGTGIPPEFIADLVKFGKSTKGERGNGMGLWTVKHILDRHHATIDVQSTPGTGTTFTIHWPINYVAQRREPALAGRA